MALGLNEHLIHLHSLNVHDYLSKVCGLCLIINEWDDPLQSVLHHYVLKHFHIPCDMMTRVGAQYMYPCLSLKMTQWDSPVN